MAALTDRQTARERLNRVFGALLDKMVPADQAVGLPGGQQFVQWEDLADEMERTMIPVFLEERAALEVSAQAQVGGRCPDCRSDRVYLNKESRQTEVRTPHGVVVLTKQSCRCRQCGRSFSPSGPRLGLADGGELVAQGGGSGGTRSGDAVVRQRRAGVEH